MSRYTQESMSFALALEKIVQNYEDIVLVNPGVGA
jgi:hypothetical protein